MARLIDADALIARFEKIYGTDSIVDKIMLRFLKKLIRKQPTVDAVEVVHGKWETYPCDIYMRCSVCRREFDKRRNTFDGNYCPHCGAKMDGGDE